MISQKPVNGPNEPMNIILNIKERIIILLIIIIRILIYLKPLLMLNIEENFLLQSVTNLKKKTNRFLHPIRI